MIFAGLLRRRGGWGVGGAYFIWGIDVLGICDLSADLTTAVNDKCIDSRSYFVPTLKVKVLLR